VHTDQDDGRLTVPTTTLASDYSEHDESVMLSCNGFVGLLEASEVLLRAVQHVYEMAFLTPLWLDCSEPLKF